MVIKREFLQENNKADGQKCWSEIDMCDMLWCIYNIFTSSTKKTNPLQSQNALYLWSSWPSFACCSITTFITKLKSSCQSCSTRGYKIAYSQWWKFIPFSHAYTTVLQYVIRWWEIMAKCMCLKNYWKYTRTQSCPLQISLRPISLKLSKYMGKR